MLRSEPKCLIRWNVGWSGCTKSSTQLPPTSAQLLPISTQRQNPPPSSSQPQTFQPHPKPTTPPHLKQKTKKSPTEVRFSIWYSLSNIFNEELYKTVLWPTFWLTLAHFYHLLAHKPHLFNASKSCFWRYSVYISQITYVIAMKLGINKDIHGIK